VTRAAFLLALPLLGACAQWPEQGGGGLAEMRPARPPAPDGLAQRLACALARMDALEQAAARSGQGTGQAALLRVIATRATREAHGSLPRDANRTLDRLGADAALLHPVVGRPALPECT
jgi:hypothetical protein